LLIANVFNGDIGFECCFHAIDKDSCFDIIKLLRQKGSERLTA